MLTYYRSKSPRSNLRDGEAETLMAVVMESLVHHLSVYMDESTEDIESANVQIQIFESFGMADDESCASMYWVLRQAFPVEVDLNAALAKAGAWFMRRRRWSKRAAIATITRSLYRIFNDPHADKPLQILFLILANEFTLAWQQVCAE